MESYLQKLIQKLHLTANNPPVKPYEGALLFMEEDPITAEQSLVPHKPIEEWTGIKKSLFPDVMRLSGIQCRKVSEAILNVFSSMNLSVVDIPEDIHPMFLYIGLTSNWDYPVQYLTLSGVELYFFKEENEEKFHEAVNGNYNDDGTKVDVDSIPLPSLCVICNKHLTNDVEENLLCLMNRHDQRNKECFECGAFENI